MQDETKEVTPYDKKYLSNLADWGKFALKAGILPNNTTPFQAMAIIQTGHEIGLAPFQSLRSMSFIKGRLTMSVQLQLALAKNKGVILTKIEESPGKCSVILSRGNESVPCTYTLEDAKKAKLIFPDGSWEKYPKQMLRWRAIGDALRLIAPDLVMGLLSPEEAESIEPFQPAPVSVETGFEEIFDVESVEEVSAKPETQISEFITEPQRKRLFAIAKSAGYTTEEMKAHLFTNYGIEHSRDVKKEFYEQACEEFEKQTALKE